MNEFVGNNRYGIKDAICAGKRIRLLDEIEEDSLVNCDELGINLFLFYDSRNLSDKTRLLRFKEQNIAHFALLFYDKGLQEMPTLLDPLSHSRGRVKLTNKGLIVYPFTSLDDDSNLVQFTTNKEIDENKAYFINADYALLTKSDVLKHLHYMNSPVGFFPYFSEGQVLNIWKQTPLTIEYSAKTKDKQLIVQATCLDPCVDIFTFQRTYSVKGNKLRFSDKQLTHLGYEWIHPRNIIYDSTNKQTIFQKLDKSKKSTFAFISFIRALSNGSLPTEQDRQKFIQEQKDMIEGLEQIIQECDALHADKPGCVVDPQTEMRKDDAECCLEDQKEYLTVIEHLSPEAQKLFLNHILFLKKFKSRSIRPTKPYTLLKTKEEHHALKQYHNIRYEIYKNKITEFLNSDVLLKLLSQYRESLAYSL